MKILLKIRFCARREWFIWEVIPASVRRVMGKGERGREGSQQRGHSWASYCWEQLRSILLGTSGRECLKPLVLPPLRGREDGLFTLYSHLSLIEGCFRGINFLALRPAPHLSQENALRRRVTVFAAGCSCCPGQCRPTAGACPAGCNTKTERNPDTTYEAVVTGQVLGTFCLTSSS